MQIGKRLRRLREAKGLSQGNIERRSGLLRSYISRVEGGYTVPSLSTLDRWARALQVQPYLLLFDGSGRPSAVKVPNQPELSKPARRLIKLFDRMSNTNRKLLLSMATKLGRD